MSSFIPLNVEIEEESEEEVDDSKEIQIEEALKLYHNALRLHSQGPVFYEAAEVAYRELFRSEIFTYPESLSEAQRLELYEDVEDSQDDLDDALAPTLVAPVTSTEGAPSTLPQILYLAYKNHGQFILDRLKHQLSRLELDIRSDYNELQQQNALAASASLKLFVEALDRDESDLQLWRQTARIGGFLGSRRITRFCLEAVLDSDENDFGAWAEPLGLEEGFAIEQLKPLLLSLKDQLSESQLSGLSKRQNQIIHALKIHVDPLPFLPTKSLDLSANRPSTAPATQVIGIPLRTWASCGQAILLQLNQEAQGVINSAPGANYCLVLPGKEASASSGLQPRFPTNGESNVGKNGSPVTISQDYIKPGPLLADRVSTVGNWLGQAEPSQASPIDIDVQIVEQALESPTKFVEAGNPVEVQTPGTRRLSAQEVVQPTGLVSLPTRKRSSEAAELPESTEGRSRSKRIKARGATDPDNFRDTTADDWARWYEQQLQIYHQADDIVFASIEHMLSTIPRRKPSDFSSLRKLIFPPQSIAGDNHAEAGPEPSDIAPLDLKNALDSWDLGKGKAFLNGHDPKDPAAGIGGAQSPSFTAFLEHSNQEMQQAFQIPVLPDEYGIEQFVEAVNQTWTSLGQLSFQWISELLGQYPISGDDDCLDNSAGLRSSSYETFIWPNDLKQSIVQILVNQDEAIYTEIHAMIAGLDYNQINQPDMQQHDGSKGNCMLLVQAIFELHIDVYGRITNPSSIVDTAIRLQQRDRLARWAALSSKLVNEWSARGNDTGPVTVESGLERDLYIRFMWAYVVCNSLMEPDSRDLTVLCFQDLIRVLSVLEQEIQDQGPVKIELPNNAIMPEISVQAAQKEISRLTTMDFFMGVFSTENNDPLTIIESLEPLLELSVKYAKLENGNAPDVPTYENEDAATEASARGGDGGSKTYPDAKLLEALHFLEQGSLPLRLFLWQKMRDAYRAINYPPQVLSCDLRILELIVNHLNSPLYTESAAEIRRDSLLRWLHRLDDHMTRILTIASSKDQPFECVDGDQIVTSLEALARLQNLLHVFALWEDTIRVGQTPAPTTQTQAAAKALAKSTDKFRDMIVKSWTLQHSLLKEAMVQYNHLFPHGNESLVHLLEHMHYALGLRCYCSLANKCFLKLMKAELERAHHVENWDTNMAQLIFDLYGVKISSNAAEMQEHGCLLDELDRRTALEIMDLVMLQVHRISIRDLLKSDLKFTVDKMQQVIKIPKILNSQARTFNNRLVNNYLKSPINPLDLYRSLQGIGGLSGRPVDTEGFEIAARGWYFLLGHVALAKFRSQKRTAAGATDDLEIARTFLRHDLEFDTERWETWYRLAQVYDTMIDEDATWTAEKLENDMNELAIKQRKAIHCYSMAVAVATRCADPSFEDTSKMADLYADFGNRVYASTREPFSMKAFELDDFQRHYNSRQVGMYQSVPFKPLQFYSAWKLASTLLRRASAQKPQNWILSYNLGKVLWKMWGYCDRNPGYTKQVHYRLPVDAFIRAIKTCPNKRDSRHPDKDPILEPHYKLASVVHKLVQRKSISPDEGFQILQTTPYAFKATEVYDVTRWNIYVLHVLRALRAADKANWHHRMVARAAHTLFDDEPNEPQANLGAKHELSQSIFTKTMAIQVWKPDNERAGRHFVYTGRYVRFMTRLLYNLNDKTGMELLARRIRKRSGEFVNHAGVWEEVSRAYLQLLRHQPICPVPEGLAEHKFQGMDPEVYQNNAARLETWMQSQTTSPPSLDILREAIELQKMNNKLFKSNSFEDLIRDVYAHLYDSVIPELHAEENRVRMRVDNILTNPTASAVGTPPPDASAAQGDQHRSKAKWVTNREIIRKAEAIAAQRAPSVPAKVLKALAPAPASEQGRPSSGNPNLSIIMNADADREAGSSVPGSVHDSADDESELSEVDEAVVDIKPEVKAGTTSALYPNLISTKGGTAEDPEEIDDETGAEANEEAEDNEDMEMQPEMQQATPAKESGVPTGKW